MSLRTRRNLLDSSYYHQIAYLESDGNSYINSGIVPSDDLRIEATFSHATTANIASSPRQYVFGTYNRVSGNVVSRTQFFHGGDGTAMTSGNTKTGQVAWGQGNANTGHKFIDFSEINTTPQTLTADATGFVLDGQTIWTPVNHTFTSPIAIYLFACNDAGSVVYQSNEVRIHRIKFYRNNALIADFVPYRRGLVGGFLEIVNGVFYTNNGTGQFRLGEDIGGNN